MSASGQMPSDYGEHWAPEAEWIGYGPCKDCGARPTEPCRDLRIRHSPARTIWRAHPGRPTVVTLPAAGRYEVATVPSRYTSYPMLDFPTAWRLARRGLIHKTWQCSYVQHWGGSLCDCGAVEDEFRRIYSDRKWNAWSRD